MTNFKHKARGVDKRIVDLANEIGMPLSRRNKELWLDGEIQLTFRKWKQGGVVTDATDEDRVTMACMLMQKVLDARKSWGTLAERFRVIWKRLHDSKHKYIPGKYLVLYEDTLDHGWMVRSPFSPRCDMGVVLCGCEERIRVDGETFDECLAKLATDDRFMDPPEQVLTDTTNRG